MIDQGNQAKQLAWLHKVDFLQQAGRSIVSGHFDLAFHEQIKLFAGLAFLDDGVSIRVFPDLKRMSQGIVIMIGQALENGLAFKKILEQHCQPSLPVNLFSTRLGFHPVLGGLARKGVPPAAYV